MSTVQKKSVLITGCSPGSIGEALCKEFLHRGWYVFAGVRTPSKAQALASLPGNSIEILELDVTVPETISRAKEIVTKRTGGKLDLLMNNAGTEFVCPLLDTDVEKGKELFDVTVWGPLRMSQAFAPLVVEAKGIITNHSSIGAVLTMCWSGVYSSAKAAEVRMSEILRIEMEPLGVRVVTVLVGSVNTPIFGKPGGKFDLPETSYYFAAQEHAYKQRMAHQGESMNVDDFAKAFVTKVLKSGANKKGADSIWFGTFATLVKWASWTWPQWYLDKSCNSDRGLELVPRR
ncbi:NADPH-dependent 1-acyldihydroxyacetone phosphate reductase [Podospora australis]|uniref:NADPH-dependent 1-acyldihydroxyacetone phosphate reductase n=1 Tax=Podospora australis TaxID=1536484 RepID=A0AAN6WNI1_9PEZI|nr:NADPH-dependent 1-acyldihydroxyacetone phosphate reductase [Podospora australis]